MDSCEHSRDQTPAGLRARVQRCAHPSTATRTLTAYIEDLDRSSPPDDQDVSELPFRSSYDCLSDSTYCTLYLFRVSRFIQYQSSTLYYCVVLRKHVPELCPVLAHNCARSAIKCAEGRSQPRFVSPVLHVRLMYGLMRDVQAYASWVGVDLRRDRVCAEIYLA